MSQRCFRVLRSTGKGGPYLIKESRAFVWYSDKKPTVEWVRHKADGWRDFVQSRYPKHRVFVVEELEPLDD